LLSDPLENPSNPEEESPAAIVTHGARQLHWPEDRVHYDSNRTIHRQVRWLRAQCQFVGLPHFVESDELDVATQQGGQGCELPDISELPQEILVRVQLARIPSYQALRTAERERRYSCFVTITASTRRTEKYRGRLVQTEEALRLNLGKRKGTWSCRISVVSFCVYQEYFLQSGESQDCPVYSTDTVALHRQFLL
jgi:hypothetical protein